MGFKTQKQTLLEADSGRHHTSKMKLLIIKFQWVQAVKTFHKILHLRHDVFLNLPLTLINEMFCINKNSYVTVYLKSWLLKPSWNSLVQISNGNGKKMFIDSFEQISHVPIFPLLVLSMLIPAVQIELQNQCIWDRCSKNSS